MKSLYLALLVVCLLASSVSRAQQVRGTEAAKSTSDDVAAAQEGSPAQQTISAARLQLSQDPTKVQTYCDLALALIRRSRETANTKYLEDADAALTAGLKLDASDFQLQRAKVALLLSRHDFLSAKGLAKELNHRVPDDVMTYGYLAEADIALGDYQEAEENAQWMMNLRPNNTPALLIGARLRTLYGDVHGAVEFLNQAYSQTSPLEVEELAWIANQIASVQIDSGENSEAEKALARAEELFPHYPYTIENLARVRMAQNRTGEAAQLLLQAKALDSNPSNWYGLAKAQLAVGQRAESLASFEKFKNLASDQSATTDESMIDLILYLAKSQATAPDALKLAQQRLAVRQDVWTLDAYAWALCANSRYADAEATEKKAMAVGIQSAQIFNHAAHVAEKLNQSYDASYYFELALRSNPTSEFASDARNALRGRDVNTAIEQAAPHVSESNLVAEPNGMQTVLSSPDSLAQNAAAADAAPKTAPVFSPVPEALLIPRATETAQTIKMAQLAVAQHPAEAKLYAALGAAYFQRARETGDVGDYTLAEQSLMKSLELDSSDFSSEAAFETMAEVCMGEHRFADALTYAHKALSLGSGELSPFAIVGDAYADMGEYSKAEDAYKRLTPRDTTLSPRAAYARDSRISYLRFIAGDTGAAIRLMKTAVLEGIEAQLPSENMAWLYYELGEYETQSGDSAASNTAYLDALEAHPGDYRALAALAKLRANHGRYEEAILLYQKAIAVVPMPIFISELGDVYAMTGNRDEAAKQYALVEYIGLLGHINQVLHNRDLALFYADHDMKLAESLDLARKELEVRRDVYTWDALAWALYKNGKLDEAAKASDQATRFGTQDALIHFHAGMIAEGLGQLESARGELNKALQINPQFHLNYSITAQQRIAGLQMQSELKGGPNSHAR